MAEQFLHRPDIVSGLKYGRGKGATPSPPTASNPALTCTRSSACSAKGHISTTMRYLHLARSRLTGTTSPLDLLDPD